MAKIEAGRWSELLRRALGMKGQSLVASELSPEVSPVWVLEQATIEWQFLKTVRACAAATNISAGAQDGTIRLANPSTSGVVGVVEMVTVQCSKLSKVQIKMGSAGDTDLTTANVGFMRDSRWLDPAVTSDKTALSFSQDNTGDAANGRTIWNVFLQDDSVPETIKWPLVLSPGFSMDVKAVAEVVQGRFFVNLLWYERAITRLEL